jgi:nucleoside-diphosphate-sugar epimerase
LIDAARGRVRRWVQLSSVGCYGLAQREGTVDERSPLAAEGEYETTKTESDALVERAASEGAFACVTLRPSIVFGPGMPNRSLYQLVTMVERGLFFFVGRRAIATYVYVDDVADALIACATKPAASGTYVLSDDRPMEAFIAAIAAAVGQRCQPWTVPEWAARGAAGLLGWLPRFPLTPSRVHALSRRVRYSPERIQRELGYEFRVSIEEGLRRFVAARSAG